MRVKVGLKTCVSLVNMKRGSTKITSRAEHRASLFCLELTIQCCILRKAAR